MVERIISGGQTGADIAGLRAAKLCGIETGGFIPKGFKTLDGYHPEYADEFGLVEMPNNSYRARTRMNVANSDATIRFAKKWDSPGERATFKAINDFGKPFIDISMNWIQIFFEDMAHLTTIKIDRENWKIINIAGNSERTCPGIEKTVTDFLVLVFGDLKS